MTFYDAFKATDNITMVPAVRSPDGTCVDESNCDYERMIACAFDTCANQDCSVDYLVCMDEGVATTAEKEGEKCCTSTGIDYTTVKACYDGDLGTQLLQTAADAFNAALPGSTYIPNTMLEVRVGREGALGARARGREGARALPWLVGWPLTRSLTHSLG